MTQIVDRRRSGRGLRPAVGFLLGSFIMLLIAGGIAVLALPRPYEPVLPSGGWPVLVFFAVAMTVGEATPLRLGVRHEMLRVTLAAIPFVIGFLLLPASTVIIGYSVAALFGAILRRGTWPVVVMNTALAVFEGMLAVALLFWWPLPEVSDDLLAAVQPRLLPVAITLLALTVISAIAVSGIHRMVGIIEPLARTLGQSLLIVIIMTGLAFVGVTVWLAAPSGPILCTVLAAVGGALYLNYSAFRRQHDSLSDLYEFGAAVAAAGDDATRWQQVIGQVRAQLSARQAVCYVLNGPAGPVAAAADSAGPLPAAMRPDDDSLWAAASGIDSLVASRARVIDPLLRAAIAGRGAAEVICAPIRIRGKVGGYLEVWDTATRWRHFHEDDRRLLLTLAGHIASALENRRLVTQLQHDAYHDSATGTANRLGLEQSAAEAIARGKYGGVLLIDLGVVGSVNSALGHGHGDQMLRAIADRLRQASDNRVIGRLDGDRFAVLFEPQSEQSAADLAEHLLAETRQPIIVAEVEVESNGVVGIAVARPGESGETSIDHGEVLQQAQLALESARAKETTVAVYRPTVGEMYQRRFQLVSQFRSAAESGQIFLNYQPKVTLATRELIGVEALVRWRHPDYGFVPPTEFIEALENTTAIDLLFERVLGEALEQSGRWIRANRPISVAVNLSVRNLLAPHLTDLVAEALDEHGVPAKMLTLEITESSVMAQPERCLPVLAELHERGIQLSVDDFGTGYSSLAYLRRLPVDELKIDRAFVRGMVTDLGDLAIVRAIIDLGHSLGLRVVAEGVEEESGRDALKSMRCDAIQGFLLARPMPIDRFENWLDVQTLAVEEHGGAARKLIH